MGSPGTFRVISTFFRQHPWQRRMVTLTLTALIALAAAYFGSAYYRTYQKEQAETAYDQKLIADLASPDMNIRQKVFDFAMSARKFLGEAQAKGDQESIRRVERLIGRFEQALHTENDLQFAGVVHVLRELGRFDDATADQSLVDRAAAVDIETGPGRPRMLILPGVIISGRDNAFIRRSLAAAIADPLAEVRGMSAVLAARLGDDATLAKLLADKDPAVAGRAAIDAAIAGRKTLTPTIARLFKEWKDETLIASTAYALAIFAPKEYSEAICDKFVGSFEEIRHVGSEPAPPGPWSLRHPELLRRLLLHVTTILNDENARDLARRISKQSLALSPGPMDLVAAAKMKVTQAGPVTVNILDDAAAGKLVLDDPKVLAAVQVMRALRAPAAKSLNIISRDGWGDAPQIQLLLAEAARALGEQLSIKQTDPAAPTRAEIVKTLQQAALFAYSTQASQPSSEPTTAATGTATTTVSETLTGRKGETPSPRTATTTAGESPATHADGASAPQETPATEPAEPVVWHHTPIPSAAAAVALWLAKAPLADSFVRDATAWPDPLRGDYVAWNLARSERPAEAFTLAMQMCPAPRSATPVYNEDERCAGAMMMALAARDDKQKAAAIERLTARLAVDGKNFQLANTDKCALLILGKKEYLPDVRLALEMGFARRRALTALLAAGDKPTLDKLLWNGRFKSDTLAVILLVDGLQDVLRAAAPDLPTVDAVADSETQDWQMQILRDTYAIGRKDLRVGLTTAETTISNIQHSIINNQVNGRSPAVAELLDH